MPQRMGAKDLIFELIEDQLRRAIFVRMDLIKDHLLLLSPLLLGEATMPSDVQQHRERTASIDRRADGVEHRLLLRREGVEFGTDSLHALDELWGGAKACPLEEHVLDTMREAVEA